MTVFATEGKFSRLSSLVKQNDAFEKMELFNELVTANEAATATYKLGQVLGKVTATGKYKIAVKGASDGSQVPSAVYISNGFGAVLDTSLVAATDTKVLTIVRGKIILSREGLILDASFSTAGDKQGVYDALKALGILVEISV